MSLPIPTDLLLALRSDDELVDKLCKLLRDVNQSVRLTFPDWALGRFETILYNLASTDFDEQLVLGNLHLLQSSGSTITQDLYQKIEPLVMQIIRIHNVLHQKNFDVLLVPEFKKLQANFPEDYAIPVIVSITKQALARVDEELGQKNGYVEFASGLLTGLLLNAQAYLKQVLDQYNQDAQ